MKISKINSIKSIQNDKKLQGYRFSSYQWARMRFEVALSQLATDKGKLCCIILSYNTNLSVFLQIETSKLVRSQSKLIRQINFGFNSQIIRHAFIIPGNNSMKLKSNFAFVEHSLNSHTIIGCVSKLKQVSLFCCTVLCY